jgi:hypothetical protein
MHRVLHDPHEGLIRDGRVDPGALEGVLALRSRHGRPGAVADLFAALGDGSVLDTGIVDNRWGPGAPAAREGQERSDT